MTLLTANNIQASHGKQVVVNDVSLSVKRNEFVGLIGPNGAGKSSLMRMLAGLRKPDVGEVNIAVGDNLKNIANISAQQRAQLIAYLAQNDIPAWPLSVKNLVALGRLPWRNSLNHIRDDALAIDQALTMTELQTFAERSVAELSGGELKRALLARVFAGTPQLILADEPIASLDIYHQLHSMELLQQHVAQGGAVVAALHDLSLAARFCSRLLLLNKGQLVAEGTPFEVLTTKNIEQVYGVKVYVDCKEDGVIIIPKGRL